VNRAALLLIDRLRATIGQCAREPHALERPGHLLDEVEHEVLSFASVQALVLDASGIEWLLELAAGRGMDWTRVAHSIWQAWDQAGRPAEVGALLEPHSVHARHFWGSIPAALLRELLATNQVISMPPELFQLFGREQWTAFLELQPEQLRKYGQALWTMPEEVATQWLTQLEPRTELGLEPLWVRFPERLLRAVRQALSEARTLYALELMHA